MHFLLGNVIVKGKGLFKELLAVGAQLLAVFIVGGEHLPRLVSTAPPPCLPPAVEVKRWKPSPSSALRTTVHALE